MNNFTDQSNDSDGKRTASISGTRTASTINIELLAEKVYQLMQQELRLTRARGGTSYRKK